jgi:hemerythrin-like domain-containing protein
MERIDITRDLRAEHDLVLDWITLIEELAQRSQGTFAESPLVAHFGAIDAFLDAFLDRLHHAKEEDVLFGVLEHAITHCGPIPVMLREHAIGRELRRAMGEAFRSGDLPKLIDATSDFCGLLAQHIAKENGVLYQLAEQLVADEARPAIRAGYAAADAQHDAGALRRRFEDERDALREELG